MIDTDDKVTIGERYGAATEAANLRVGAEQRGPADYLIAAGWLEDSLGALLFRLQHEYDAVRGEHELATDLVERMETAARAAGVPPAEIRRGTAAAVLTARLLILQRLKTLRETKPALQRFACQLATKARFMRSDAEVAIVAGRALDVFLSPTCHHCNGRGFNGGRHRGEATATCRPCEGTGHRKGSVGKDVPSRRFAACLLGEMDRLLSRAAGGIGRALRTDADPGTIPTSST